MTLTSVLAHSGTFQVDKGKCLYFIKGSSNDNFPYIILIVKRYTILFCIQKSSKILTLNLIAPEKPHFFLLSIVTLNGTFWVDIRNSQK